VGAIGHDRSKPDGTPRKLMSVNKLRGLGWVPKIELRAGIENTYRTFLATTYQLKPG
jgi:GDP-L-fucose synthase